MEAPKLEYFGTWEEIVMHASEFRGRKLHLVVVHDDRSQQENANPITPRQQTPTARELLQLPQAERDRILAEQCAEAELMYRSDSDLTDFDACDDEDLFDGTT